MNAGRRTPSNTTAEVAEVPLGVIAASLGRGGFSQAIEEQERSGQAQLVNSTVLPVAGSDDPALAELGFTFGDVVQNDPLFREATLPDGWTRQASDHSMHSDVVDERGIPRVSVFYKAAFYDRRADMHLVNVGYSVATQQLYSDGPVALHEALTRQELREAKAIALGRFNRNQEWDRPDDQARDNRARHLIGLIDERLRGMDHAAAEKRRQTKAQRHQAER